MSSFQIAIRLVAVASVSFVMQTSTTCAEDVVNREAASILIVPGPSTSPAESKLKVPTAPAPVTKQLAVLQDGKNANADSDLPKIVPLNVYQSRYSAIYRSIPFMRSEYRANPSYRHDATMELLFGKMRPMSINRHYYIPRRPTTFRLSYPYMNRPGLNYNFFYPTPSVYRRY